MSPRIEEILSKIARQVMAFDEETLTALIPKYREKMLNFTPTRAWEESVLVYFIINGLRIKNSQFNDKIKEYMTKDDDGKAWGPHIRPHLRLISGEKTTETSPKPLSHEEIDRGEK